MGADLDNIPGEGGSQSDKDKRTTKQEPSVFIENLLENSNLTSEYKEKLKKILTPLLNNDQDELDKELSSARGFLILEKFLDALQ